MKDEEIDKLLEDLDAALSVQPSPSVAARVRTRIAETRHGRALWLRGLAAATAVGAVIGATYLTWPTEVPAPAVARVESTTPTPAIEGRLVEKPAIAASPEASSRQGSSTRRTHTSAARTSRREPEVLISPDVRMAVNQLRSDVATGRFTVVSFVDKPSEISPTIIVPWVLSLPAFRIDTVPFGPVDPAPVGGKPDSEGRFIPPPSPLSRTRSTL